MTPRCERHTRTFSATPEPCGPAHHSLRTDDRADPQFAPAILVDGYQPVRLGQTRAVAVTAYPLPHQPPIEPPPWDMSDFECVQYMMLGPHDDGAYVWLCDISWEKYPDTAFLFAGRRDATVVDLMLSADLLLVLTVPTSTNWTTDHVRLIAPNDTAVWSPRLNL